MSPRWYIKVLIPAGINFHEWTFFKIWQVLIFIGKHIIFPSSMNVWLMENKNGINNEKKMSVADLQFLDFQSLFRGCSGYYFFREINQNDRNRENTGTSVPLK